MSRSGRIAHSKALPNYQKAVLPREKLYKYVLDLTNPVGRHKAILFKGVLGFVQSDWGLLAKASLDAILAFRRAKKLAPDNEIIQRNLRLVEGGAKVGFNTLEIKVEFDAPPMQQHEYSRVAA